MKTMKTIALGLASLACCGALPAAGSGPAPVLTVGHVGHDHQTALYVALDNRDLARNRCGIDIRVVKDRQRYEIYRGGGKIADLDIILVGGGSKMPTALAQGIIDAGLGGVPAVFAAADGGAPVKLISPLHSKGDMLAVRPGFPADDWTGFVEAVSRAEAPVLIGYKSPVAVAKLVFEDALLHEGLTFSGDPSRRDVDVRMVNVKGGGRLNASVAGGLIDGYAGNNPFPEIGAEKGIVKVIADLEDLPPGRFRDHPCCCVAANAAALKAKREALEAFLEMIIAGTEAMNTDVEIAAEAAARWIGTSVELERRSIATSGYSTSADDHWRETMGAWLAAMNDLDQFAGKLKGLSEREAGEIAYDLSLLEKARERLQERAREAR